MWGLKLVKWGSQISDIGSPYRGRKRSLGDFTLKKCNQNYPKMHIVGRKVQDFLFFLVLKEAIPLYYCNIRCLEIIFIFRIDIHIYHDPIIISFQ